MKIKNSINEHHSKRMQALGVFCDAVEVEYIELDEIEEYIITKKNGERFSIHFPDKRVDGSVIKPLFEIKKP